MSKIPEVTLNNGVKMPQFGLGVWQARDGHEVKSAVMSAIAVGYRLIDTAAVYGNEKGVGQAIKESGIDRSELFITTKLWNADQGYDAALRAFGASLERLGLEYVDLYLIHWPVPAKNLYTETWRALEKIYEEGRAKAIGVSNFLPEHLDTLLTEAKVIPAVNQVELHPRFTQAALREYCEQKGIVVEAYSPLGGSGADVLHERVLQEIGSAYHKSPAQVVLRWHIQLGHVVIPKSVHEERIKENREIFDFELTDEDMRLISELDTNMPVGADPATANFT